jgi:hypothetical protein
MENGIDYYYDNGGGGDGRGFDEYQAGGYPSPSRSKAMMMSGSGSGAFSLFAHILS